MRACNLDTSREVGLYRPGSDQGPAGQHKTAHHAHQRVIPLGQRAQELINGFLTLDTRARGADDQLSAVQGKNWMKALVTDDAHTRNEGLPERVANLAGPQTKMIRATMQPDHRRELPIEEGQYLHDLCKGTHVP
jgi:hypothetical protein